MGVFSQNKQGAKVLLMGSVLQLFLGIIYVWSVFVVPVSEGLAWDVEKVKLTTSFMLSFFVVGILIGGRLLGKLSAPKIVLTGGVALSAGMFATAFVPGSAAWLIYLTYGIVGGFGVGMAYNAIISSAQKWFPKNRGLATGVSVCAFGFSTVVFAPLVEFLIERFGLQSTLLILSAAFLLVTLAVFGFIKTPEENANASGVSVATANDKRQYAMSEALKTKEFYYITISMMLGTAAYFILNPSFKTLAGERGLEPSISTVLVMITGLANALGRLGVPFMSDKIGRERTAVLALTATAVCSAALSVVQGFAFIGVVALIAFCYGGFSGIYPVITGDYFGVKNVGSNYGAVMVGFAFSALVFPMVISGIASVTAKFIILAILAVIGALLMVLLMNSKKKMS